ncbi:MAG: GNAT family N-acetyltransferase [Nitrospiraceae bacterium]|nr:GNAT family N-acetyltransferase [Nitrospiraceae bacterium]
MAPLPATTPKTCCARESGRLDGGPRRQIWNPAHASTDFRGILGVVSSFVQLSTPNLTLLPFDAQTARAVVNGDLSSLSPAEGWPHEDTVDGLSGAVKYGWPAGWMVMLEGKIIGDCGTHGPANSDGVIEIGYGLAAPFRGRGFGTELVGAASQWLLGQPDVRAVIATTLVANVASRRVLEKNAFVLSGFDDEGQAVYRLSAPSGGWSPSHDGTP